MTTNKELRDLAEKATPGPWGWDGPVWGYDAENEAPWLIQEQGVGVVITGELQCSEANAEYIATASPEVITALLDENESLQAECEKLRKDAARYQWLKHLAIKGSYGRDWEFPLVDAWEYRPGSEANVEHETLDAAIDAAMQGDNPC